MEEKDFIVLSLNKKRYLEKEFSIDCRIMTNMEVNKISFKENGIKVKNKIDDFYEFLLNLILEKDYGSITIEATLNNSIVISKSIYALYKNGIVYVSDEEKELEVLAEEKGRLSSLFNGKANKDKCLKELKETRVKPTFKKVEELTYFKGRLLVNHDGYNYPLAKTLIIFLAKDSIGLPKAFIPGYTDEDGKFSFSYSTFTEADNLLLHVFAANDSSVCVPKGKDEEEDIYSTSINLPRGKKNIVNDCKELIIDSNDTINVPLLLTFYARFAYRKMKSINKNMKSLTINYPTNKSTSYTLGNEIYIIPKQVSVWTVTHEYGHYVAKQLGFQPKKSGGDHNLFENLIGANLIQKDDSKGYFPRSKERGINTAFSEGFADFFSAVVVNTYIDEIFHDNKEFYRDTFWGYKIAPLENNKYLGECNELTTASALYSMLNGYKVGNGYRHKVIKDFKEFISYFEEFDVNCFSEFIQKLYQKNVHGFNQGDLGYILSKNGFAPHAVSYNKKTGEFVFDIYGDRECKEALLNKFNVKIINPVSRQYDFVYNDLKSNKLKIEESRRKALENEKYIICFAEGYQTNKPKTGRYISKEFEIHFPDTCNFNKSTILSLAELDEKNKETNNEYIILENGNINHFDKIPDSYILNNIGNHHNIRDIKIPKDKEIAIISKTKTPIIKTKPKSFNDTGNITIEFENTYLFKTITSNIKKLKLSNIIKNKKEEIICPIYNSNQNSSCITINSARKMSSCILKFSLTGKNGYKDSIKEINQLDDKVIEKIEKELLSKNVYCQYVIDSVKDHSLIPLKDFKIKQLDDSQEITLTFNTDKHYPFNGLIVDFPNYECDIEGKEILELKLKKIKIEIYNDYRE